MPPSMAATLPTLGSGLPVAIGQIDRELKKLWDQSGGVATRASLINLAVYCENQETMARNTELIARITQDHACRALLICAVPNAPESKVQAWISAHCHMSRAGAKQVCCEQISFLLEGPSRNLIPNIVFSHLDSDLPLYLFWQGEFPDPIDSQLWTWVDRLIYDSNDWRDVCNQLKLLRESLDEAQNRLTLCDLNWTRSLYMRQALSLTFDHPANLEFLPKVDTVTIQHAPEFRSTALLLVGWLASRLQWTGGVPHESGLDFSRTGGTVGVVFQPTAGPSISACVLEANGAKFAFSRDGGSDFLHSDVTLPDGHEYHSLLPPGKGAIADLLNEELMRGGRHRVYLASLAIAEPLFACIQA